MKIEPFSYRYPYEVWIRLDVTPEEAEAWIVERFNMITNQEKLLTRSWITRRVIGFKNARDAMEFKLKFG